MVEFKMPSLGSDMVSGRLVEWRKQPGDVVHRGDIMAEVDTDKGVIEVEIFTDGVVEEIVVRPGEKVAVGTVLARIREGGEDSVRPAAAAPPPATGPTRRPVSPRAKRRATELGVDIAQLTGTGPVTESDVEAAAGEMPELETTSAGRMRRAIAAAMARSKREIPHYYLSHACDVDRAYEWIARENEARPASDRLLHAALFLKAVALGVRDFPEFNAWYQDGSLMLKQDVHVGVAIALRGGGLVAPALHHTDGRALDEISVALRDLVTRARRGTLRSSEVTDATITVTSLGDRGVDTVFGVIYPPQVAIVGIGTTTVRPWADAGTLVARRVVTLSLAADHRASDGHQGALFLSAIADRLRRPEAL